MVAFVQASAAQATMATMESPPVAITVVVIIYVLVIKTIVYRYYIIIFNNYSLNNSYFTHVRPMYRVWCQIYCSYL